MSKSEQIKNRKDVAIASMEWVETTNSHDALFKRNKQDQPMNLVSLRERLECPVNGEREVHFDEPPLHHYVLHIVGTVVGVPCHIYINKPMEAIVGLTVEHDHMPSRNFVIFASNKNDVATFLKLYLD